VLREQQMAPFPYSDIDRWLWPLLHEHAPLRATALCPQLRAFQAEDAVPLWQAIEAHVGHSVDAPFFAVAWPGAQALARAVQDGLIEIAGRRVLDLGCGSGLAAVAAAQQGAALVTAADVDALALSACRALARAHGVQVRTIEAGLPLRDDEAAMLAELTHTLHFDSLDVLLVGDLVYHPALGRALRHTLAVVTSHWPHIRMLIADSGRPYFDALVRKAWPLRLLAQHTLRVPFGVEGQSQREVSVYAA
jgi:predicted nicotinamide N-methyase